MVSEKKFNELVEKVEDLQKENKQLREKVSRIEDNRTNESRQEAQDTKNISRRSFMKKTSAGIIGIGALSFIPATSQIKISKDGIFSDGNELLTGNSKTEFSQDIDLGKNNIGNLGNIQMNSGYMKHDLTGSRGNNIQTINTPDTSTKPRMDAVNSVQNIGDSTETIYQMNGDAGAVLLLVTGRSENGGEIFDLVMVNRRQNGVNLVASQNRDNPPTRDYGHSNGSALVYLRSGSGDSTKFTQINVRSIAAVDLFAQW